MIKLGFASTLLASGSYISSPVLSPYKMDIRQKLYYAGDARETWLACQNSKAV
jgi:hypothetical protein